MQIISFALLQAQQASPWTMPIMLMALFAIMYILMIRPQNKKQKEIANFRNALTVGQEVVTVGGLHGTIKKIDNETNTVTLNVATGVELKFDKASIMPSAAQK